MVLRIGDGLFMVTLQVLKVTLFLPRDIFHLHRATILLKVIHHRVTFIRTVHLFRTNLLMANLHQVILLLAVHLLSCYKGELTRDKVSSMILVPPSTVSNTNSSRNQCNRIHLLLALPLVLLSLLMCNISFTITKVTLPYLNPPSRGLVLHMTCSSSTNQISSPHFLKTDTQILGHRNTSIPVILVAIVGHLQNRDIPTSNAISLMNNSGILLMSRGILLEDHLHQPMIKDTLPMNRVILLMNRDILLMSRDILPEGLLQLTSRVTLLIT